MSKNIEQKVNIDIFKKISLNNIIVDQTYTLYNCVLTYSNNTVVLIKNNISSLGYFEFEVKLSEKDHDMITLLHLHVHSKFLNGVQIYNELGILNDFNLKKKKFYFDKTNKTKHYKIVFSSDSCVICDLNVNFLKIINEKDKLIINTLSKDHNLKLNSSKVSSLSRY